MRNFDGWFIGRDVKDICEALFNEIRDDREKAITINVNEIRIIMYKERGLLKDVIMIECTNCQRMVMNSEVTVGNRYDFEVNW